MYVTTLLSILMHCLLSPLSSIFFTFLSIILRCSQSKECENNGRFFELQLTFEQNLTLKQSQNNSTPLWSSPLTFTLYLEKSEAQVKSETLFQHIYQLHLKTETEKKQHYLTGNKWVDHVNRSSPLTAIEQHSANPSICMRTEQI